MHTAAAPPSRKATLTRWPPQPPDFRGNICDGGKPRGSGMQLQPATICGPQDRHCPSSEGEKSCFHLQDHANLSTVQPQNAARLPFLILNTRDRGGGAHCTHQGWEMLMKRVGPHPNQSHSQEPGCVEAPTVRQATENYRNPCGPHLALQTAVPGDLVFGFMA